MLMNKKGVGVLTGFILVGLLFGGLTLGYLGIDAYKEAHKVSNINVNVGNTGAASTSVAGCVYLPVAWNLTGYESGLNTKAAGTYYAMPYQGNAYEMVANNLYFDSCDFTTTSLELVSYAQLEGSPLWDKNGFYIYGPHDSSTYNANWQYVEVKNDRCSETADTEVSISVTKKGGISEDGTTTSTVGDGVGSDPYWETDLRSSYTDTVIVKLEGNTSAGLGEEVLTFYIDEVNQPLTAQGIGQYYWIGKIFGDRELKVVCTRATTTDENASIVTTIYSMPDMGSPSYYNYGDSLFTETNTD